MPYTDESGKVIGVKYRKRNNDWTAYDFNTVKGQWGIYQRRAEREEVSEAIRDGLEKWQYALSLFEDGREELKNIKTITV